MDIGVVSDTHGQVAHTRAAVTMLWSLDVEMVIHCGDIGSPQIIPLFSPWATHFVFGNVDDNRELLEEAIAACGQTCHGRFGALDLAGVRIAILHGDDERLLRKTIHSGQWDLVCHGHTHVARRSCEGKTLVLNPGAIYRANPHSIAIVRLPSLEVTPIQL